MSGADHVVIIQGEQPNALAGAAGITLAGHGETVLDAAVPEATPPDLGLPENWPAGAELLDDGSVHLTLKYPVRFKLRDPSTGEVRPGDSYERLHLMRLKGKHKEMLLGANGTIAFEKMVLGCSLGLDAGKISLLYGEMDQADIAAALVVLTFFTGRGRKTGPAS